MIQVKRQKYQELWNKIKDLIRSKTNNLGYYDEKYMKIKFNSDDDLPPRKTVELCYMVIIRAAFHEDNITHSFFR